MLSCLPPPLLVVSKAMYSSVFHLSLRLASSAIPARATMPRPQATHSVLGETNETGSCIMIHACGLVLGTCVWVAGTFPMEDNLQEDCDVWKVLLVVMWTHQIHFECQSILGNHFERRSFLESILRDTIVLRAILTVSVVSGTILSQSDMGNHFECRIRLGGNFECVPSLIEP